MVRMQRGSPEKNIKKHNKVIKKSYIIKVK